jgi:hypothetical protein
MKKLLFLILASVYAFSYLPVFAYETDPGAQEQAGKSVSVKQARWEGVVQRVSKDKSTLTVRKVGTTEEKTVHYDNSTKWVSQEHGSKKVNDIDSGQVQDGDRVICLGTEDKGGFHATLISKRLTRP